MAKVFGVIVFLVLTSWMVKADTVIGNGGFLPLSNLQSLGTSGAYWNNPSLDGPQMNIGYFLTGTGGFPAACGINILCGSNFLGASGAYYASGMPLPADAPNDFSFLRNSTSLQITVLGAYAGKNTAGNLWSGNMPTSIGYYDASSTTTAAAAMSEVPLWAAGAIPGAVGTTVNVIPYLDYGFYETVCTATVLVNGAYQCVATATFFSNSNLNPAGETDHQHFAVFTLFGVSGLYYIGFEDLLNHNAVEGAGDYNDVVIRLFAGSSGGGGGGGGGAGGGGSGIGPASPLPEPATFSLIGMGLLVMALARSRRAR